MRTYSILAACLASSAYAWHLQIHNQIAFMAERLLTPEASSIAARILDPKYCGSIGKAAAWADTVRKVGAPYSYNWHFIDLHENVSTSNCSNRWDGVCDDGDCVVAQIANQTAILTHCVRRLKGGSYQPDVDCQQALMWVVHFIGDVAQPLHTSGTAQGGNLVKVLFNGTATNLHDVWDRLILYSGTNRTGDFSDKELDPYFAALLQRINHDSLPVARNHWARCDFEISKGDHCPKRWAEDSHALVCNAVYHMPFSNTTDLMNTGYARDAFPTAELQLAKAAWRLAGWLNHLVTYTPVDFEVASNEHQVVLEAR
ncbi:nuclease PA3 [Lecanosticta acicola]|uniref:Nuclease PA3 n=1 Tax=Lecanosticta acicola TaxID=111012 RepID=A0AAI9EFR5_9PEZI|nr:nuclease PA3 [Lecanosticta acicola]